MKVKYRSGYYNLSFKNKIQYNKKRIYLFYKRVIRFIKRVLKYNINLLWILVVFIIFMLILIPIGISLDKYNSIFDGIWDFRNTILTTFVIAFFVNTITTEKQRHANLKKQYDIYYSLETITENFINELLKMIGYTYDFGIFIDEDNTDYFLEKLDKIEEYNWNIPDNIEIKEYLIYFINNYIINISYETNKMDNNDVIGIDEYDFNYLLDCFNKKILIIKYMNDSELDEDFIKKYIAEIIGSAY